MNDLMCKFQNFSWLSCRFLVSDLYGNDPINVKLPVLYQINFPVILQCVADTIV